MSNCSKRVRSRCFAAILAAAIPVEGAFAAREAPNPTTDTNPISLYGDEIHFDVVREGRQVGFHRVRFAGDAASLAVEVAFELRLKALFFTFYRFDYRSESRWRGGMLERLSARVDDDGTATRLNAIRDSERFMIESTRGASTAAAPLFPTNHWNAAVLGQSRVLNTLTGRVNNVRIERIAREPVETERGAVTATRYAYRGELAAEVWYDDAGRWVKLRFEARDGSTIEYICRRCQGPSQAAGQ